MTTAERMILDDAINVAKEARAESHKMKLLLVSQTCVYVVLFMCGVILYAIK